MLVTIMTAALMVSTASIFQTQGTQVAVGMTRQRAETILKEGPDIFMVSGGISGATITEYYYNRKLIITYGPDGKVGKVLPMKR